MNEPAKHPIITKAEQHYLDLALKIESRKTAIFAAMKALLLESIVVTYDGESDEGQIESITGSRYPAGYVPTNTDADLAALVDVDLTGTPAVAASAYDFFPNLHELAEDLAWNLIEMHDAGFEDNDGGYGEITFDAATGKVRMEINRRFVDVATSELEA
ncbi:hypothetical protein RLW55_00890 [Hyphomicrobium sp. B1]|uniref:DUF6878 family protein n=1 Tax=unclassified Hyphomicrobium TaxID=2619925 RepID=UPI00391C7094